MFGEDLFLKGIWIAASDLSGAQHLAKLGILYVSYERDKKRHVRFCTSLEIKIYESLGRVLVS